MLGTCISRDINLLWPLTQQVIALKASLCLVLSMFTKLGSLIFDWLPYIV